MNFLTKLKKPTGNFALIAEIKLGSPAEGFLGRESQAGKIARQYQEGGADALSVVTEKKLFRGSLKLIEKVKKASGLPILCKDFVTDKRKLEEIAAAGADAVLLLARLLTDDQLRQLAEEAQRLALLPIAEADNENDLKRLIRNDFKVIAVNARNLSDHSIDRNKACRLLRMIPGSVIKLAFSGVRGKADIRNYMKSGAKGILIGTTLMKSGNRSKIIKEFRNI